MTAEVSLTRPPATDSGSAGILVGPGQGRFEADQSAPDYFPDLNLDQLVSSIVSSRAEYDLSVFFHTPVPTLEVAAYRHDVFHDLEETGIADAVEEFAAAMRSVRRQLGQAAKFHYAVQRQTQHLSACQTYLAAVRRLQAEMAGSAVRSDGLTSLKSFLDSYVGATEFSRTEDEAAQVREQLGQVHYRLHVYGDRVEVSRPADEEDYAADVMQTFARFRQGQVEGHAAKLKSFVEMDHVEAAVIDRVKRLYPKTFAALETFEHEHRRFLDDIVTRFDREVQFYLAYLDFADRLRAAGLCMCYPEVLDDAAEVSAEDAFDAALAAKLVGEGRPVVTNDFCFHDGERVLVVTGPNQGGKTTFARMVGQMHHLAALGVPVPGRRARLTLADRILTHFEQGENLQDLSGKLEDGLHQPAAGGRDQPHPTQDPGCPAGGDVRGLGVGRRGHPPAARAVHRPGDRQPRRVRGHLPAARGAARPVHTALADRLPGGRGRGRDGAASA